MTRTEVIRCDCCGKDISNIQHPANEVHMMNYIYDQDDPRSELNDISWKDVCDDCWVAARAAMHGIGKYHG